MLEQKNTEMPILILYIQTLPLSNYPKLNSHLKITAISTFFSQLPPLKPAFPINQAAKILYF